MELIGQIIVKCPYCSVENDKNYANLNTGMNLMKCKKCQLYFGAETSVSVSSKVFLFNKQEEPKKRGPKPKKGK